MSHDDSRKMGIEVMRTKALQIVQELYHEAERAGDASLMRVLLTAYNRINTTPVEEEVIT